MTTHIYIAIGKINFHRFFFPLPADNMRDFLCTSGRTENYFYNIHEFTLSLSAFILSILTEILTLQSSVITDKPKKYYGIFSKTIGYTCAFGQFIYQYSVSFKRRKQPVRKTAGADRICTFFASGTAFIGKQ